MKHHQLRPLRQKLQWTQAVMAAAIGLTLRAYCDLESGKTRWRKLHELAFERLLMREAARRGRPHMVNAALRRDVEDLFKQAEFAGWQEGED